MIRGGYLHERVKKSLSPPRRYLKYDSNKQGKQENKLTCVRWLLSKGEGFRRRGLIAVVQRTKKLL